MYTAWHQGKFNFVSVNEDVPVTAIDSWQFDCPFFDTTRQTLRGEFADQANVICQTRSARLHSLKVTISNTDAGCA